MGNHRTTIENVSGALNIGMLDRAMVKAAEYIINMARQHNQGLLIWRDGRSVEISPDEAERLVEHRRRELENS